jgi:MFS family permease
MTSRRLRLSWVRDRDEAFTRLWFGQAVSQMGSQVSLVAIPLLAAVTLGATPLEMGILTAAETGPYLLVALPVGVIADRADRRLMMIACDIGRLLALLAIPALWAGGLLNLAVLAVVAFVTGCLSVGFDVAATSYLPEIIEADSLVEANQQLEVASSGAQIAGPGIGGLLFTFVGGALAVLLDALSYAISAISLAGIRRPGRDDPRVKRAKPDPAVPRALRAQLLDGPRIVLGDRVLRDLAVSTAAFNLASSMILATFTLFAVRELGIGAAGFGLVFALGNVGFLVGAIVSARIAASGLGRALTIGALGSTLATMIIPLAMGPLAVVVLLVGRFVGALSNPIYNVSLVTLVQGRVNRDSLGRVNGTFRLVDWGVVPVGALLGGVLGGTIGLRPTLLVAATIAVLRLLLMINSPARRLRAVTRDDPSLLRVPADDAVGLV